MIHKSHTVAKLCTLHFSLFTGFKKRLLLAEAVFSILHFSFFILHSEEIRDHSQFSSSSSSSDIVV